MLHYSGSYTDHHEQMICFVIHRSKTAILPKPPPAPQRFPQDLLPDHLDLDRLFDIEIKEGFTQCGRVSCETQEDSGRQTDNGKHRHAEKNRLQHISS